tara:strand:- start:184 stop:1734 length:1551 start_codon:yes stop_codon:yes gene_type:complete
MTAPFGFGNFVGGSGPQGRASSIPSENWLDYWRRQIEEGTEQLGGLAYGISGGLAGLGHGEMQRRELMAGRDMASDPEATFARGHARAPGIAASNQRLDQARGEYMEGGGSAGGAFMAEATAPTLLDLIPGAKTAGTGLKTVAAAAPLVRVVGKRALGGLDQTKLAKRYPSVGTPVEKVDKKTGKKFLSKGLSEEEKALQKARNAIDKDIKAGEYEPYFDVEGRYYADPSGYDIKGNTLTDTLPKKQVTIDKKIAQFDTPEARAAIEDAYRAGVSPRSKDWYAMGQLEAEFIRVLGEVEGRKQFKARFADAMAATTGGADPGANLLTASYANFQRAQGLPLGSASYEFPHPIGGRYVTGNINMYDKVLNQGGGLSTATQPKRHNFSANFLGDMNRATIDEQMTRGMTGGKFNAPPDGSYGVMEQVVHGIAKDMGIMAGNVQDVSWAGFKGSDGKPMIEWVNEMIYRTSQVTGKSLKEVVEGFIKGDMPMYGIGGAALTYGMLQGLKEQENDPAPHL